MTARPGLVTVESVALRTQLGCDLCAANGFDLCQAMSLLAPETVIRVVPARRVIYREHELYDEVPFICDGWAACAIRLSNGSRQILSILLPGDMVSAALLFDARADYLVEAITDVHYRTFKRADVKASLFKHPDLFEKFSKAFIEEKIRADQLVVDLGRRTAEERIARLILNLEDRLSRRGMANQTTKEIDFPLRQHHIADATGLTPVHVSKVLSEFRRSGLVKISDRSLAILEPARFRRIALARR
jgi:CRP/FNR family transcriptional regulator, anaerobic regulatory protein